MITIDSCNPATMAESLHEAKDYGFDVPSQPKFDWSTIKKKRDAYIQKLNSIYDNNLQKSHVEQLHGLASFVDLHTIRVTDPDNPSEKGYEVQGKHILIATGNILSIFRCTRRFITVH